jgi:hypothetical protein
MKSNSLEIKYSTWITAFVLISCCMAFLFTLGFSISISYAMFLDGYLYPFRQKSNDIILYVIYDLARNVYYLMAGIGTFLSLPHLLNRNFRLFIHHKYLLFCQNFKKQFVKPPEIPETKEWFETKEGTTNELASSNITFSRLALTNKVTTNDLVNSNITLPS